MQYNKYYEYAEGVFKYLHHNPELSMQEYNTSNYCKELLKKNGYEIKNIWHTGFVADLNLGHKKTIAFRADMDALPIAEESDLEYKSKISGVSHMCGHDGHMAIVLGLAKICSENKDDIKHNIRLIFQPSEEEYPGGAKYMIENGCLDIVDEIYALHNSPKLALGKIKTNMGPMSANSNPFYIDILGKSGHAAYPDKCLNPIYPALNIINSILYIKSSIMQNNDPCVINITNIQMGTGTPGVIAEKANIIGAIRSFGEQSREKILNRLKEICSSNSTSGYKVELTIQDGYPSIENSDKGCYNKVIESCAKLGYRAVTDNSPEMWAEDFSYYLQKIPGAFFILGSKLGDKSEPLHSCRYRLNPKCIPIGINIMHYIASND